MYELIRIIMIGKVRYPRGVTIALGTPDTSPQLTAAGVLSVSPALANSIPERCLRSKDQAKIV